MDKVAYQPIDRTDRLAPAFRNVAERRPLRDPAFVADHLADSLQLPRQPLVRANHVVERVRDFSPRSGPVVREPDGKVTALEGRQRAEQLFLVEPIAIEARPVARGLWARGRSLRGFRP